MMNAHSCLSYHRYVMVYDKDKAAELRQIQEQNIWEQPMLRLKVCRILTLISVTVTGHVNIGRQNLAAEQEAKRVHKKENQDLLATKEQAESNVTILSEAAKEQA